MAAGYALPPAKRPRVFEPRSGFSEQILAAQPPINIGGLKTADSQPVATQIVNAAMLQDVCSKLIHAVASHRDGPQAAKEGAPEPLPSLSAPATESNPAVDALLCDEAIGPSPSPPVHANGVMTIPPYRASAWYLAREKRVFSEFSGVMKHIAQSMQAKAAQKGPLKAKAEHSV
eukprot:TRINITY_DN27366_c0_g1_i4.p1 TRINITY_DN27366_c0_g1~~TRINITY_DN27366_c0_g1_i4.p1  ORF type:complete len:174 (-),score=19.70 TRINITY_DN27366_c0_g1_i4:520-1041(-)